MNIELVEVKAKSFDSDTDDAFLNKNGTILQGGTRILPMSPSKNMLLILPFRIIVFPLI